MLEKLEQKLNYQFKTRSYLDVALTHRSYNYEHGEKVGDNERLEFLGDALLSASVAEALFLRKPELNEGQMTRYRAAIVCESTLAELARSLHLGDHLRFGIGEERSNGSTKASNLSNAMEAVFAAIYLDSDFETVKTVIQTLLDPYLKLALIGAISHDYKSRLLEYVQSLEGEHAMHFSVLKEEGKAHERHFTCQAQIDDGPAEIGEGKSKKQAEQEAARKLYQRLVLESQQEA